MANHHEASDFQPWAAAVAAQLTEGSASLKAGQRLGPYEILAPIGKGGMGEVYKARDTRLNRDVAIKICAAQFSERFEREARVIASLNHPNICQLYDVGPNYLVMELVEGETLSGPLPVETALNYARQIEEALEAAHEKGIVHRDLKPANIKITPAGVVKVLDFGLAKAAEDPSSTDPANATTLTMSPTRAGMILGTAQYMSPEQARGAAVDKRADIWAFGCVLYEMLTGKRAFQGETTSDILAAVLKQEPDWSRIPANVQRLLRRCLVKDPKDRLRDIGDAIGFIENTQEPRPVSSLLLWTFAVVAAVLLVTLGAVSFVHFREAPSEPRLMTTSIEPPENTNFDFSTGGFSPPALSPDGRRIVFRARGDDGKTQLWIRPLDSPTAQPLAGTQGASHAFWSPDSRSLAFSAEGKLKRMEVAGGPALSLADLAAPLLGGSWSHEGTILFSVGGRPVQRVAAVGGPTALATIPGPGLYATLHTFPWFFPDGRHFLFGDRTQQTGSGDVMVRVGVLDSQEVKTTGRASAINAVYSNGYVLFLRENTLMAQQFDEKRLATTGNAVPVAEQVRSINLGSSFAGVFAVSQEGLLAYQTGQMGGRQMMWFDRSGKPVGTLGDPGEFTSVDFSPDRKRVAVTLRGQNDDIWIYDVMRGFPTRLTFTPGAERDPIWSPDGRTIVYLSDNRLYRKASDGTGNEESLYADEALKVPESWSPDGKFLLYGTAGGVWVLPLGPKGASGAPSKLFPSLAPGLRTSLAKFSPNGNWVAYASNESGRSEIYVAPFPGPGVRHRISTGGGSFPRWRADGNEIFYERNGALMAAEVSIKGGSVEGRAVRSLGIPVEFPHYLYDVSADGQRFLVATPREQKSPAPLTLVQNWTVLLKKR